MIVEAVTTCVDYADYLAVSLPRNRSHFDRIVVVTSEGDAATHALCAQLDVPRWICPPARLTLHGSFNKGCAINDGLRQLSRKEWIVHLDADIVLPDGFRAALEARAAELDPQSLYTMPRSGCPSWADWERFLATGEAAPMLFQDGLGYFQMVHARADRLASGTTFYPESYGHPELTDLLFSRRFLANRRNVLDMRCIHLGPHEVNWRGRVSPPFVAPER